MLRKMTLLTPKEIQDLRQRFCVAYGRATERAFQQDPGVYDTNRYEIRVGQDLYERLLQIYPWVKTQHRLTLDFEVPEKKIEFVFPKKEQETQ